MAQPKASHSKDLVAVEKFLEAKHTSRTEEWRKGDAGTVEPRLVEEIPIRSCATGGTRNIRIHPRDFQRIFALSSHQCSATSAGMMIPGTTPLHNQFTQFTGPLREALIGNSGSSSEGLPNLATDLTAHLKQRVVIAAMHTTLKAQRVAAAGTAADEEGAHVVKLQAVVLRQRRP